MGLLPNLMLSRGAAKEVSRVRAAKGDSGQVVSVHHRSQAELEEELEEAREPGVEEARVREILNATIVENTVIFRVIAPINHSVIIAEVGVTSLVSAPTRRKIIPAHPLPRKKGREKEKGSMGCQMVPKFRLSKAQLQCSTQVWIV